MRLDLVDRRPPETDGADPGWRSEARRRRRLSEAVADLGLDDWRLNLVLVTDAEMAELNAGYRNTTGVTDVLSFSYLSMQGTGAPDLAGGRSGNRCDLWCDDPTGESTEAAAILAGELILAPDHVTAACRHNGWDLETELTLLVVHSTLHVLGWTHDTTSDQAAMREAEAAVLARLGMPHPLQARS